MSYVQLPSDGSGKKVQTVAHTIDGQSVNTQVQHIADGTNPENYLRVDDKGAASVRFSEGEPIMDAFGNLKTSESTVIAAYEHTQDSNDDLFTTTTSNGGAATWDVDSSSIIISASSNAASSVVRTTNRDHYYFPGVGQFIVMTIGLSDAGKTNNIREWGYYNENDGLFFRLSGTTLSFVTRSSTSGSPVETTTTRATWEDPLDGTGLSGYNIDLTKINLFWIDFQWLGAGRVRFGVVGADGSRITAGMVENAGLNTLMYMRTAHLPMTFTNKNVGAVSGGSDLRINCLSIKTEGKVTYTYWRYTYDNGTTPVSVGSSMTPLLSLRSKTLFNGQPNHANAYPESLGVYVAGGAIKLVLYWPVTLTGATWAITDNGSTLEADNAATSVTVDANTWIMRTFFLAPGCHEIELTEYFEAIDEGILLNADGTKVPFVIAAHKVLGGDTVTALVSLNYKELR